MSRALKYLLKMSCYGVLGVVIGAVGGGFLAFCTELFACAWNIVTLHWFSDYMAGADYLTMIGIGALVGGFLGIVFGYLDEQTAEEGKERELQRAAEEKAEAYREEAKKTFDSWKAALHSAAIDVVESVQLHSKPQVQEGLDRFFSFEEQVAKFDEEPPVGIDQDKYKGRYGRSYQTALDFLCKEAIEQVCNYVHRTLHHSVDDTALEKIEAGLYLISMLDAHCRKGSYSIDFWASSTKAALSTIQESIAFLQKGWFAISFEDYGVVTFGNDDPREWSKDKAEAAYDEFCRSLAQLDSEALTRDCVTACATLSVSFFRLVGQLMWHYADATPFNVERFDEIHDVYNAFTAHVEYADSIDDNVCLGTAEEVLARIYVKNKMGGSSTVKQEEPYLFAWVDDCIAEEDFTSCFSLVSGLAWLGLFDLEQRILRIFVDRKVQLTEELQNRLGVLESGRTSTIRLFDVEPTDDFVFDSSSMEWNAKDLSYFFRNLAIKKTDLVYSLALDKWTKALPLRRGLKVSSDEIFEAFEDLVLDYDGEVSCERVTARAADLTNLRYADATLFRFSSDRSRCLSILFTCEKFGRNLNVTIYTLFTPESGLPLSELETYAMAAKSNMYMETFRESILQTLDETLKVEKSIYGDDEAGSDAPITGRNVIA